MRMVTEGITTERKIHQIQNQHEDQHQPQKISQDRIKRTATKVATKIVLASISVADKI